MNGRFPAFRTSYMQAAVGEVKVVPPEPDQLTGAQAMPIGHQNSGGVPMAPTVLPGSVHQPLDLGLFQVLARSLCHDCYIYCGWSLEMEMLIFHDISPRRK
jgi:hypothetical protein